MTKTKEFRDTHMDIKNYLFSVMDLKELSRDKIFPVYFKEHQIQ